jgi:hypothetical protein
MRWSIVPSPNPPVFNGVFFSGVSCLSTTKCFAVGGSPAPSTTLTEQWNGTSWSILPNPIHPA